MKHIISLLTLFLIIFSVAAQEHDHVKECGTDEYHQNIYKNNPELAKQIQSAMEVSTYPNTGKRSNGTYIIPIVFHVIHENGNENIPYSHFQSMIKQLNEDYNKENSDLASVRNIFKPLIADIGVEFRIARIDPDGNCTNGVTRTYSPLTSNATDDVKSLIQWNNKNYLNVWVVKSIDNGGESGMILGYATFPGGQSSRDGIVIRADRIGYGSAYRTLTHEVGHYLGLYHPFQGGCSSQGDRVDDTPPESTSHFDCNVNQNSCSNDSPDQLDMIENHMCYSSCRVMFTEGQKTRMEFFLSNYRSNIYSKTNLEKTGIYDTNNISCKSVAAFKTENPFICQYNTVQYFDESAYSELVDYYWSFPGGLPEYSTDQNPVITYNKEGKYTAKLIVSNSINTDSILKEHIITVFPSNGRHLPFFEDFESNSFNDDIWILDYDQNSDIGWQRSNLASKDGDYSIYLNNYELDNPDNPVAFILPSIDLSYHNDALLEFDYSNAKIDASSKDQLRVYVSTNCGENWSMKEFISPTNLTTVADFVDTEFVPTNENEWKHFSLDLSRSTGYSNVLIKISLNGYYGNNIYLDNISLSSSTAIEDVNLSSQTKVYPNPAKNLINIEIESSKSEDATIRFYDITGKLLYKNTTLLTFGQNKIEFDLNKNVNIAGDFVLLEIVRNNEILKKKILIIR